MLVKTAGRNLANNKGKTIVIVLLIALGSFLILVSRGVMGYSLKHMHALSVAKYSGNVFISGVSDEKGVFVSLFGPGSFGVQFKAPKMPYLDKKSEIEKKLSAMDKVASFSSGITAMAAFKPLNLEADFKEDEEAAIPFAFILGVNAASHEAMFGSLSVYEGEIPRGEKERWLSLPRNVRENFEKRYKRKLNVGDEIEGTHRSDNGPKSIRFKVASFFDYPDPESSIEGVAYADLDSVREIASLTKGAKIVTEIPKEVDLNLSAMSEDELFSGEANSLLSAETATEKGDKERDVFSILGDTKERDILNMADTSAWHYITVRTKNPMNSAETKAVISELNEFFKSASIKAEAHDWNYAMSMYTLAMDVLKFMYNVALGVLSVVVLIVIMNTLVISAMERTREIGTMRALGAKKSFVGGMFFVEMACMVAAGLLFALLLAFGAELFFNAKHIEIAKSLTSFFGAKVLKSNLTVMDFIKTALTVGGAAAVSTFYPVAVALRISPLKAMSSE